MNALAPGSKLIVTRCLYEILIAMDSREGAFVMPRTICYVFLRVDPLFSVPKSKRSFRRLYVKPLRNLDDFYRSILCALLGRASRPPDLAAGDFPK